MRVKGLINMKNTNKIPKEKLEDLYAATIEFKKAKPWEWMSEKDLICVENPQDKTIGYCSIMGSSGIHFALAVYLGYEGLAALDYFKDKVDTIPSHQTLFYQDCLMCSFENRDLLENSDLKEIKSLGLSFRGKNAWPQFRRYEPGFYPWFINEEECEFLTHALRQTLEVANQIKRKMIELELTTGKTILRKSTNNNGDLSWESTVFKIQIPKITYRYTEIEDELLIYRLKKLPKSGIVLEAETCYLPMTVQEKSNERPYFPRAFILADANSGQIIEHEMYEEPRDDAPNVLEVLINLCLELDLPLEIQVKPGKMVAILKDICNKTGIRLKVVDTLPSIDELLDGMARQL